MWKQCQISFSWVLEQLWNEKTLAPWKENYAKPRQSIKKQRHHFADKDPCSQNYGFSSSQVRKWWWCSVAQSCPTLSHPMACSMPSSSVHGISQARILEWVAISFSRGSSWPRDRIRVSCIGRWILYHQTTREALRLWEIFRIIQNSKSTRLYASENLPLFPRHSGLLPDSDKCY